MSETTGQPIRLLLVDDHAMFREGLARMLEKEPDFIVAGQAASPAEALEIVMPSGAAVVLLDVDLGASRAMDFVSRARGIGFRGRILIVTAGMSDQEAVQLIQSGVGGILHKHHSAQVLCGAIRQVAAGEAWLEPVYLGPLFRTVDKTRVPKRPSLTERDRTVLRFLLSGLTNREMAVQLEISEGAVKASLRHVCEKLGVKTRTQLVKVALEQHKDQL
jgi:two-component system, NarL family, nitrate/nitrite response regulator NarL